MAGLLSVLSSLGLSGMAPGVNKAVMNAELAGIAQYSGESMEMAASTLAAANAHATDSASTLAPVMGPLGAQFQLAFAQAEASYLAGAAQVAATHVGMGIGTADAVRSYATGDAESAVDFTAINQSQV